MVILTHEQSFICSNESEEIPWQNRDPTVHRRANISTCIKILYVLFESELCVCDIARLLNLTQSAVSHQLRILKASNLVRFRREGKTVFYSLDDDHVRSVLALGMEHVLEK